jgi:hypothetical protein
MTLNTFDEADELRQVRQRYENVHRWFPHTLQRLGASPEFRTVYFCCREAGLLDWHILSGIASISWNYRLDHAQKTGRQRFASPQHARTAARKILFRTEAACDVEVPVSEFTVEAIQMFLDLSIVDYLQKKGFVVKRATPNLRMIRRFADQRFRFMTLDVGHEPPFPAFTGQG